MKVITVDSMAKDIISELINLIISSQSVDESTEVLDNEKIFSNVSELHKQVFVKVS